MGQDSEDPNLIINPLTRIECTYSKEVGEGLLSITASASKCQGNFVPLLE